MVRIGAKAQKWLKSLHLVAVGCWVGGGVSLIMLHFLRPGTGGEGVLYGINQAAHQVDMAVVVVPGAFGCLLTGLAYSLLTGWGFFKHGWLVFKWVVTVSAIIFGTFWLGPWETAMMDISGELGVASLKDGAYLDYAQMNFLWGAVQVAVLAATVFISVLKPWKNLGKRNGWNMTYRTLILAVGFLALLSAGGAFAQQDAPPPPVVVAKVTTGDMAPQSQFIGTVYFTEISNVASEVEGKVLDIKVTDGHRVKEGDILVVLSSSLLEQSIRRARALVNQARAEYESANLENKRVTTLFKSQSVAEGEFDSKRLSAEALQHQLEAARADLAKLLDEADKKKIKAPYDGIVIDTPVTRGEWISMGDTVVVTARDDCFDVVVNAPREAFGVVKPGLKVGVGTAGDEIPGEVFAVIPRGDVATRTFPVKIRVKNNGNLAEGMEARVFLPKGLGGTTMVVHRDALISVRGEQVVWAVLDGKAVPIPVYVVGFRGLMAGVKSAKLKEGMDVVVKGNERLRPGQAVTPQPLQSDPAGQ